MPTCGGQIWPPHWPGKRGKHQPREAGIGGWGGGRAERRLGEVGEGSPMVMPAQGGAGDPARSQPPAPAWSALQGPLRFASTISLAQI